MNVELLNKKAFFEYEILDRYMAGIALTGTEIKSVRNGKASLSDAYCSFLANELYVRNMHIAEYEHASFSTHEPKRSRKLLLKKKELKKLLTKVKERGLTIIPLKMFLSKTGFAKLEIGLAKGKKIYDKRQSLKEKEHRREERMRQE